MRTALTDFITLFEEEIFYRVRFCLIQPTTDANNIGFRPVVDGLKKFLTINGKSC